MENYKKLRTLGEIVDELTKVIQDNPGIENKPLIFVAMSPSLQTEIVSIFASTNDTVYWSIQHPLCFN